ncbi:MAG: ABC transporter ATP-binding protein [Coriobacteriia bacterium]|nr:ABC transporter ATP-binding protein [Coriobacteriia bacterium]
MIEVKDVVKTFGSTRALDGVTMTVPRGAVYGLVGPNGAGKTTLLEHIAGMQRPDGGQVLVDGAPVYENLDTKAKIAFVPSDLFYLGQARIRDMRDLHAIVYPTFDQARFAALSHLFDLDENLPMRSLSKGMTKQVAFWLALAQSPDLLLLDEPLDGLDPATRRKVWGAVMDDVAERGMTVLTSSHNLRELTDVCDHVGMMEHGRMLLEHPLAELQEGFVKVQVAFADDQLILPQDLNVLHTDQAGRLFTLVVRGSAEQAEAAFGQLTPAPTFVNILPLTLEEIFIYEMGGDRNAR